VARRERVVKKARAKAKAPVVRSGGGLAALKKQIAALRADNARLQDELAQYIEQWETLDGPQVSTLQYLAGNGQGRAAQVAKMAGIHIQIAETSLTFLHQCGYVSAVGRGARAQYLLSPKGARYLRSRGMYK
jgi:hypothetical protein